MVIVKLLWKLFSSVLILFPLKICHSFYKSGGPVEATATGPAKFSGVFLTDDPAGQRGRPAPQITLPGKNRGIALIAAPSQGAATHLAVLQTAQPAQLVLRSNITNLVVHLKLWWWLCK